MKLDTKDYIIIGLVIFCIWIYFNPFNNDKIKELEKDNDDKSRLYAAQYFVPVDVWREMQLNRIL
jgi:hypothetical protein